MLARNAAAPRVFSHKCSVKVLYSASQLVICSSVCAVYGVLVKLVVSICCFLSAHKTNMKRNANYVSASNGNSEKKSVEKTCIDANHAPI